MGSGSWGSGARVGGGVVAAGVADTGRAVGSGVATTGVAGALVVPRALPLGVERGRRASGVAVAWDPLRKILVEERSVSGGLVSSGADVARSLRPDSVSLSTTASPEPHANMAVIVKTRAITPMNNFNRKFGAFAFIYTLAPELYRFVCTVYSSELWISLGRILQREY